MQVAPGGERLADVEQLLRQERRPARGCFDERAHVVDAAQPDVNRAGQQQPRLARGRQPALDFDREGRGRKLVAQLDAGGEGGKARQPVEYFGKFECCPMFCVHEGAL